MKEIETKGPESFIELNVDKIQDLQIESSGVKKWYQEKQGQTRKPYRLEKCENHKRLLR
jgi:hypothetical protein